MRGFFQRIREGLQKTTRSLFGSIGGIFSPGSRLDAADLDQLEEALFTADFGVETTETILDAIREAVRQRKELRGQDAAVIGARVLMEQLEGAELAPDLKARPTVIALVGVNGSGKTTTTAKLAWRFQEDGQSVLIGACDTFRAAANEQLRTWADRLQVELVASQTGADAAAVAFDALQAARQRDRAVLLLDTAGRLHTKSNLMQELAKLRRVLQKLVPEAPHESWLVVDGSLGANSIEQARIFHRDFGLTGLVVTKLDGTSRGGAIVQIWRELQIPIAYVGVGEAKEDLHVFDRQAYAAAVFGLDEAAADSLKATPAGSQG